MTSTPSPAKGSRNRGSVLAFVVLLALALLALGHAILVGAEGAYTASRAYASIVEGDAASSGALVESLESGWQVWMDSLATGGIGAEPPTVKEGIVTEVEWRRLSHEAWLLTAASSRGGRTPIVRRRLAWIYDPEARIEALPGIVSVGIGAPVELFGSVTGDTSAVGAVDAPTLGLLELPVLLALADAVGPRGVPGPVERLGACDAGSPWNWGSLSDPTGPCGSHVALKGRVGDLEIESGEGRVVLIVDGDVLVRGGAELEGLLVVSGQVTLSAGATMTGRVLASGGIRVDAGAEVIGSGAAAAEVLRALRSRLGLALPLHAAHRLGPD